MKKIIFAIFSICLGLSVAQAQNYIKGERTEDNYHVSKFQVNEYNKTFVMSTPLVDEKLKIYDFAELLSNNQREEVYKRCMQFMQNTGLDVAIVTQKEIEHPTWDYDTEYETYIKDFYDYNDFGKDGLRMLIILSPDRTSIFDAGQPADWNIAGSHLSEMGSVLRPLYDQQKYYEEIITCLDLYEIFYLEDRSTQILIGHLTKIGIALALALIVFFVHKSKYKLVFAARSANNYKVDNSFRLTHNTTKFVRTYTTKIYSPRNTGGSSSRGSSSGGSSSGGSF